MFMSSEFEKAVEDVKKIFEERGTKVLEDARSSVMHEKIESNEAREALNYFITHRPDVLRPALLSLACEAVGGDPLVTASVGKALILLSGAFDIHDDIIDKTVKRGRRLTIPGKFGSDIALLAGDAFIFKGLAELFESVMKLDLPPEKKLEIVRTIKKLYFDLGDAEAMELKFRARADVKPEDYIEVVRKKAGDVEAYMKVGAMVGGGSEEQVKALGEYGRLLGMMIILRDDLQDLLDFDVELPLRIKNESLPLPILYALGDKSRRSNILAILRMGEISGKEARKLFKLVSETGGIDKLEKFLNSLHEKAILVLKNIKKNKEVFIIVLHATVPKRLSK
jgi:geranylgeranyl diphosphate synthase type I